MRGPRYKQGKLDTDQAQANNLDMISANGTIVMSRLKTNVHTALIAITREEMVFLLDRRSLRSLGGANIKRRAAGPIVIIDCSNKRVKSKFERHP
jgi:hypothetical protein